MKENLSEIICIVDRSGSMDSIKTDAIGGFNSFLSEQKKLPGEARFTLVLFNHDYELVHDCADIQKVPPLNEQTYVPAGTTALLDAVGRTIDDVGKRLHETPESERPNTVIVAILTDGLENASKDYTNSRISEMIKHQQEKYNWEFVFLAANQDAIATAKSLSIKAQDAMAFNATASGVREGYAKLSQMVGSKRQKK